MLKLKKEFIFFLVLLSVFLSFSVYCFFFNEKIPTFTPESHKKIEKNRDYKIFYVDSYNRQHTSNIKIRNGFIENLPDKGFDINYEFLDAKNNKEAQLKEMCEKVYTRYNDLKPDIVLISDDAAVKYFANEYLRNKDIPVIFTGVNWSCDEYDLPCENITGQLEIELVEKLVDESEKISTGERISILTTDSETDRKNVRFYKEKGIIFKNIEYVKNVKDWKEKFLLLSRDSDILFLRNNANIKGWDDSQIKEFVNEEIKIPTVTISEHMADFCVLSITKDNYGMGRYLAEKTEEILIENRKIQDIPLSELKDFNIIINAKLASILNIDFDVDLIDISEIIR